MIAFRDDLRTTYAVTRCLEIISEASRGCRRIESAASVDCLEEYGRSGQRYRHEYEDVAVSFVWVVLEDHLPPLRIVVEQELAALRSP